MKIFRHANGNLYTIQQIGKNNNITPNKNWSNWEAIPYKTNKNAEKINIGSILTLDNFELVSIT